MSHWYLGTIGFSYKEWVGEFYPIGTTSREYLHHYHKVFNSVELDTTFHSIPHPSTVQSWYDNTPEEFVFCLKTPRVITHELRLKGAEGLMNEFLNSLSPLQHKIGPLIIQLPPTFTQANYPIVEEFLNNLPRSHRYAIEFRHPSWYNEKTKNLLSETRTCWVTIDFPRLPKQIYPTADFLYIRWIGINGLYHRHSYERVDKTADLKKWIEVINPYLEQISDIYGYFNNDYAGFAAGTCKRLMNLLDLPINEIGTAHQERLF